MKAILTTSTVRILSVLALALTLAAFLGTAPITWH
jgi:hypothetical protein